MLICFGFFYYRQGFSAEQLARWVNDRTDVMVCAMSFSRINYLFSVCLQSLSNTEFL